MSKDKSTNETVAPVNFLAGHSNDKPKDADLGSIYYEIDTGHRVRKVESGWVNIDVLTR